MAKLKDGVSRLSSAALVIKGRNIVTLMTGNPVYSGLQALLPAIADACNALDISNQEAQFVGGKLVFEAKRNGEALLRSLISALAPAVQAASGGDAEKILSAGFDVARKQQRHGVPDAPEGLQAVYTPFEFTLKFRWTGQEAAKFYQLEQLEEDGNWTVVATTTRTTHTVKGLVSGQRYSFRAIAVGAAGSSAASQVVSAKAA